MPDPSREEQAHMEMKAHLMLRTLERRNLVVRRKGPDGRTVLFERGDVEADLYPSIHDSSK